MPEKQELSELPELAELPELGELAELRVAVRPVMISVV